MNELLRKLAAGELVGFILVLARVTPLFIIAPLFSSSLVPPRVRGIIAVGISIGLTPIAMHGQHIPSQPLVVAELVIEGLLVGFGFAFTLAILLAAVETAGAMIDVVSGFSYGELINPMTGQNGAVISRFYSLVGTMIFLVIGGEAWTLRGLGRTFELVPLTSGPRMSSLIGGAEQAFAGRLHLGARDRRARAGRPADNRRGLRRRLARGAPAERVRRRLPGEGGGGAARRRPPRCRSWPTGSQNRCR